MRVPVHGRALKRLSEPISTMKPMSMKTSISTPYRSDEGAIVWLSNRGIKIPGPDYTRVLVVSGFVVAELRNEPRTWECFFAGTIYTEPCYAVEVRPRTPVRRYLEKKLLGLKERLLRRWAV